MKRLGSDSGMAYLLALITLVTGLILVCAVMRMANSQAIAESKRASKQEAEMMAEAGISYAYYLCKWQNLGQFPYTETVEAENGSFTITIVANPAVSSSVKATSVGNIQGTRATKIRVMPRSKYAYQFALLRMQAGTTITKRITSTTTAQMFFAGNVTFDKGGIVLAGPVNSSGTIFVKNGIVTGAMTEFAQSFVWPPIDLTYYQSQASIYYGGNITLTSLVFPFDGAIVYCNGDLKIKGPITGSGTLVASHDIVVTDDITMQPGKVLACLAPHKIEIQSAVSQFAGVCYAHNAGGNAEMKFGGATALNGPFAGDRITLGNDDVSFGFDQSKWNAETYTLLRLPGFY